MEEESVNDAHRLLWRRAKYRGKTLVRFRVALSTAVARCFPPSILSLLAHFLVLLLGAGTKLKFLQIIWLDTDPYAV